MSITSSPEIPPVQTSEETPPAERAPRGFAAMDRNLQRQIARLGGQTAHKSGQAHKFTKEEARLAGRKGGQAVSRDRDYMADIGRRGGTARSQGRAENPPFLHD